MQSIPDGNLGEIERSKAEMEAFRKRRKSARKKEERVITAVKCPKCEQMIANVKEHACLTQS
jgi:hypothetical protein